MKLFISPKYGYHSDSVRLIEAARAKNIETETLLNAWHGVSKDKEPVALYGDHAFCEFVAQEMHWNLWQNSIDWITKIPNSFVKRDIVCCTLAELKDIQKTEQSILDCKWLEPADDPCFQPAIYTDYFPRVPEETPILASTVHEWVCKYRFVCIKGKIATSCCYRINKIFNTPNIWNTRYEGHGCTAESVMNTILNHFNTAPACVIDIGYIKEVGWSVISTQPIWAAEIYGCDASRFLDGLFYACQKLQS